MHGTCDLNNPWHRTCGQCHDRVGIPGVDLHGCDPSLQNLSEAVASDLIAAPLETKVPLSENLANFIPAAAAASNNEDQEEDSYFTYQGSLTTPGCQESVTWILFRRPLTLALEEVIFYFRRRYDEKSRDFQSCCCSPSCFCALFLIFIKIFLIEYNGQFKFWPVF